MNTPDILTQRLRLVAITPALLDAEAADARNLEPLLHARIPAEWPDSNWEPHVFDFLKQQFANHPETLGWTRYVILPGTDPVLIGTVGGGMQSTATAEIGYAILKPWQRQGLATEATKAIIETIFTDPAIHSIIAHTYPRLPESIRVMQKCGLTADGAGDEPDTLRYRLNRPT